MKDRTTIMLLVRELLARASLRVEASRWSDELDLLVLGGCRIVYDAALGIAEDFSPMHKSFCAWLAELADAL